jgi:CelD/BcsL family acetyltransferase involved in cellulose biosynthesis
MLEPANDISRDEWNALALRRPTPFLTHEWITAWNEAFGGQGLQPVVLRGADGAVRAAAWVQHERPWTLCAAANVHSGDWDVVARDAAARRDAWEAITALGAPRVRFEGLVPERDSAGAAAEALRAAGYRLLTETGPFSPVISLSPTWDEQLEAVSRNLRSQFRRRHKALEREGELVFRTMTGGADLDAEIDRVFSVEGSGWKAREGTAILSDERSERLYRSFARAAAERGWLRLHLLELDGRALAVDLSCVIGDAAFLIKTGYAEDDPAARLSPGLVLRGEAIRHYIEEGLATYDLLGGADTYKLRWTNTLRARVTLTGYRGAALAPFAYRKRIRPVLKAARDLVRSPAA